MGNALPVNDVTVKHCSSLVGSRGRVRGKNKKKSKKKPYLGYISNKKVFYYNVLRRRQQITNNKESASTEANINYLGYIPNKIAAPKELSSSRSFIFLDAKI